jgi:predicted nucleotidyltransferase
MSAATDSPLDQLCEKVGKRWDAIDAARKAADAECERIGAILTQHRLVPSDTSFVVFGSLARREWTNGSDVDWTLLIDGQADARHLNVAQSITRQLDEAKLQPPGPTGIFGNLAFSHDIIHRIGGDADTNRNTTQRILLLLESAPIGSDDSYRRVINQVLNRYLDDDLSFLSRSGQQYKVPRFLLNDIVRYWRTMCVDYAGKHRERQGEKWALKNAKLRMSRKLIFAAGMLTCFSCYLKPPPELKDLFDGAYLQPLLIHLQRFVRMTPLEILADAANSFAKPETAERMFDAYDRFLSMMNDGEARRYLAGLKSREAQSDKRFEEIRSISREFQNSLTALFFDDHKELGELTRQYGIF